MNRIQTLSRRRWVPALALLLGGWAAAPAAAAPQTGNGTGTPAAQPGGGQAASSPRAVVPAPAGRILLFPATLGGAGGAVAPEGGANTSARQVQEAVTDALRKYLGQSGVGVVVYNLRLPSIQRAVSEGTIKSDVAAGGPGDDPRVARQLAETAGATEYLTAAIDDYRYDPATRTASFNLSVFRNATGDAAPIDTAAVPGRGVAPADVAASRQEGSAAARAAEAAAEQAVQGLFPRPVSAEPAMGGGAQTSRNTRNAGGGTRDRWLLPALGVLFGIIVLSD